MNKLIAYIFAALILFGVGAFIGIKLQKPAPVPTFSAGDSITIDSIKNRIDTIKIRETVWRTKIKTVREADTVVYAGTDTTCLEIIERKNRLIQGQDTLIELLDLEARTYSDLCLVHERRNITLSDSINTITQFYRNDSIAQAKTFKKAIQKENNKTFIAKVGLTVSTAFSIYVFMSK